MIQDVSLRLWRSLVRSLARRSLAMRPVPIVAITGSVGKSTTTAFIAELLESRMRVQVTQDNMNLGWAIGSTLLGQRYTRDLAPFVLQLPKLFWRGLVKPQPVDAFVLEIATNYPGDIPTSLTMFRPSIAVYTTVTNAHVGNFASADALFEEKAAVIGALPSDGIAVLCNDDERVRGLAARHRGQTLLYGFRPGSDVSMTTPVLDEGGQKAVLTDPDGSIPLAFPELRQPHHLYAVMAAWCVGRAMGMPRDDMAARVQMLSPLAGRGRSIQGIRGTLVIDDSHNASPVAAIAAIKSLALLSPNRRRVAVLGDMKELGEDAQSSHYEVGCAAGHVADILVAVGEWSGTVSDGFSSVSTNTVLRFENVDDCIRDLDRWLAPGDTVLVKGSHSLNLQRLVKRLRDRTVAEPLPR